MSRNTAVNVNTNFQNGKHVDIAITYRGSDIYYAICAAMGTTMVCVIAAAMMKPRTDRIFFYITAGVNMVATVAYFTMGSNLGWVPIDVEWVRLAPNVAGTNREIFYTRYIDWVITTPLLLMDLLLTAGLPWPTIFWCILVDEVMIITGLIGTLVKSRYKWGFYSFGCAAMFYVFWIVAWEGRLHAKRLGKDVYRVYMLCGVLTLCLWLLYPVAWGLCEGGNVIPPDSEVIFYGVLDLCAKPGFSIMLIAGHWNIDPARMGLRIRDVDDDPTLFKKEERNGASNGQADAVTNAVSTGFDSGA